MLRILCMAALPAALLAQGSEVLRVFSEFTRIDPFGAVVTADRGAEPRHILSPGFARHGYASLRVAVKLDKPGPYILEIGLNPENAVKVQVYKEVFERSSGEWIPDRLLPISLPYNGRIPDADGGVPGQTTATFWLDMWVDAKAPVDRIKIEPQVYAYENWYTYPMEARILAAVYPASNFSPGRLPQVSERSDAAAIPVLRGALCGGAYAAGENLLSARQMIRRNAQQLVAFPRTRLMTALQSPSWCTAPVKTASPEWMLRFRDAVLNARESP